jgi:hypothetical protein
MREIVINRGLKKLLRKTKVVLHDDIDQLLIDRFNKINKFWMLHDNLGSSFIDIDNTHIAKLILIADNKEKIIKELENLRILIFNIINEINPSHMAFACMVHSIDDKEVTDFSDEGIKRTLKRLSDVGLTEGELKKKMSEVREKIYGDLELFFPDIFHNVLSTAFWAKLKEKALKQCNAILTGVDMTDEINDADRYFATLIRPKSFSGKENEELRYDKYFEKNCIILSSLTNKPVKEMSTKEYFALVQYYNNKDGRKSNPKGRYN